MCTKVTSMSRDQEQSSVDIGFPRTFTIELSLDFGSPPLSYNKLEFWEFDDEAIVLAIWFKIKDLLFELVWLIRMRTRDNSIMILEQKPVQTGLTWFFLFDSVFFQFFLVFSVSVRFGFFSFRLIKPKSNWSVILKF